MERTRLIDEATIAKLRMTSEEANAVVELWAIQNRIAYDPLGVVSPTPAGLVIPQQDVRQYLNEIRGQSSKRLRPARSIGADVRLAAIAALVLLIAALGFAFAFGWGRRTHYPVYPNGPMYGVGPTVEVGGMSRSRYLNSDNDYWLAERSSLPVRYVFANGQYYFQPHIPTRANLDSLKVALSTVVGGPLAESSRLSNDNPTQSEISRALVRPTEGTTENGMPPEVESNGLVDWRTIKVAYGGKITEAQMPYARVSNKALRDLVQKEQERIIERLAESALALGGPPPATEVVTEAPSPIRIPPRAARPGIR